MSAEKTIRLDMTVAQAQALLSCAEVGWEGCPEEGIADAAEVPMQTLREHFKALPPPEEPGIPARMRAFIETIARLSKDGEPQTVGGKNTDDDEDDEYVMEGDDAVDTVNTLISDARDIVADMGKDGTQAILELAPRMAEQILRIEWTCEDPNDHRGITFCPECDACADPECTEHYALGALAEAVRKLWPALAAKVDGKPLIAQDPKDRVRG